MCRMHEMTHWRPCRRHGCAVVHSLCVEYPKCCKPAGAACASPAARSGRPARRAAAPHPPGAASWGARRRGALHRQRLESHHLGSDRLAYGASAVPQCVCAGPSPCAEHTAVQGKDCEECSSICCSIINHDWRSGRHRVLYEPPSVWHRSKTAVQRGHGQLWALPLTVHEPDSTIWRKNAGRAPS